MSDFSRWSYTHDITFWPVQLDEYHQESYGEPYTLKGSWVRGGTAMRDTDNVEFVPRSRFYFEATDSQVPIRQWLVDVGAHTGNPPETAERIRRVDSFDNSTFGDASPPDYVVYT